MPHISVCMALDNGRQLTSDSSPPNEFGGGIDSDTFDLLEYDEDRVQRVLEYESKIQFDEIDRPPEVDSVSFREAVLTAFEENNCTLRHTKGRIQHVDIQSKTIHLTYIVDNNYYTTELETDSVDYSCLLEYCEVPPSSVQSLTGKYIPVRDRGKDTDSDATCYPLLLPKNYSSTAQWYYEFIRSLYKYRLLDFVDNSDTDSTSKLVTDSTVAVPKRVKILLLYLGGFTVLGGSLWSGIPLSSEILNFFVFLTAFLQIVLTYFFGVMFVSVSRSILKDFHTKYLSV
jgi:hypothetical protein